MEKISYVTSERQTISFGNAPPFSLDNKEGFEGVDVIVNTTRHHNQDGEILISKNLNVRNLIIEGAIISKELSDFYLLRNKLNSVLNHNVAGTLTYENTVGRFEIDVIPETIVFEKNDWEVPTQGYRITWLALDPYWTDKSEIDAEIPMAKIEPMLTFPLEITPDFEFSQLIAGDVIEIHNGGDVAVGAVFTINVGGPLVNPRLYNVLTQEYFALNGTFVTGTKLRISTLRGKKRVEQDDGSGWYNIMTKRKVESKFLQLEKGINYLQLQADSGVAFTTSYIRFEPKILGV